MCNTNRHVKWVVFLSLSVVFLFCSCRANVVSESDLSSWIEQISPQLRQGDIVFRKGNGVAGHIVLMAGGSAEAYSHIGIVACKDDSSGWVVCHAVPGEPDYKGDIDRVKCESIESFFCITKASNGKVVRVACSDSIAQCAANLAMEQWKYRVPFDHDYNWVDTTSFYCTQLVAWSYLHYGIDLVEGRNHPARIPGFNGVYIFPSDIEQSNLLTYISYY